MKFVLLISNFWLVPMLKNISFFMLCIQYVYVYTYASLIISLLGGEGRYGVPGFPNFQKHNSAYSPYFLLKWCKTYVIVELLSVFPIYI